MTKKMPTITATTMIEFLLSHGFEQVRQES